MHKKLLVSKYTAIIQLIHGQLIRAVSIYALSRENKCIKNKDIPLSKGKTDIKISYTSGVALYLSKSHNSPPFSIASLIASDLSANSGKDLLVEVLPSGLIHIEVSDLVLAAWLQSFIKNRSKKKVEVNPLASRAYCGKAVMSQFGDCVFSIQYVHARCCSLLRLAQQEKLIDFNHVFSEPMPWLDAGGQLRLNHQAERRLISSLVKVVDELEPAITRPVKWEGAALGLVRAFEGFWLACRIHDDLKTTAPEIVMARVGLIMATQSVLKFLLEEKLGIPACLEL